VRAGHAYVVLDGTLIPIDRVAADRPFYSGKHKKHGEPAGHRREDPVQGKNKPDSQKQANKAHAKLRAPGERANAQLKTWTSGVGLAALGTQTQFGQRQGSRASSARSDSATASANVRYCAFVSSPRS
jgi:hypothetical protein